MFRSSGPLQYIHSAAAEYFDEYGSRVYGERNNERHINDAADDDDDADDNYAADDDNDDDEYYGGDD